MSVSFLSRWPFLAAVALVSAAVSDVMLEAVANTGVFGAAYYDTDDSSIIPALIAALLLAGYVIGLHVCALARGSRVHRRDWLADAAAAMAARAPLRDFPAIAGMQFGALFVMESLEQIAATGHVAGGTIWLGGPVILGVLAHLAVSAGCALTACWLLRRSLARFASLVCCALEFVLCALGPRSRGSFIVRRAATARNYAQAVCVRYISGRAPPLTPTPT